VDARVDATARVEVSRGPEWVQHGLPSIPAVRSPHNTMAAAPLSHRPVEEDCYPESPCVLRGVEEAEWESPRLRPSPDYCPESPTHGVWSHRAVSLWAEGGGRRNVAPGSSVCDQGMMTSTAPGRPGRWRRPCPSASTAWTSTASSLCPTLRRCVAGPTPHAPRVGGGMRE
jgi:hypothetical protein